MVETAKESEELILWTEYLDALNRYLKALHKVREKQAEISGNLVDAQ